MRKLFVLLIRAYQNSLSLFLGGNCRFYPSCSEYGQEAIEKHGVFRGTYLVSKRFLRCNPLGPSGYDPVPDSISCHHCRGKR